MRVQSVFFLFSFVLMAPFTAPAASNPYGIPNDVDDRLHDAFQHMFNLRFDDAKKILTSIRKHEDQHPMISLAEVVLHWWKLSIEVLEVDPQVSEPFMNASERCMEIAERRLADGDEKGEAHVAFGTTLGLLSRWSAANRAWVPAYTRGVRSARYLERALAKNPQATDAYMTLGTFNYARELLQKRLSKDNLVKGQKKTQGIGIGQLRKAYKEAFYFKHAAGLLLAGLLTNENPREALPILTQLQQDLPENGFVQIVLISDLYNLGKIDQMEKETETFFQKIESKEVPSWFVVHAYFAKGLISFRKSRWKEAAEIFAEAVAKGEESNPYFTWSILYQGYALDAAGRRKEAKEHYEKVLGLKRRFSSHDHAKARLSRPFKPTDVEMRKLEL